MPRERAGPEREGKLEPSSTSGAAGPAAAPLSRAELFSTVFVTGAAVMLIEILGTRIIGPIFGVSLFVWSALLAVTLGALAIGYYVGGVLADRAPDPRLLGLVVALSGAFLGLVPPLSHAVLRLAEGLGPRAGALVSATLLFAPCLALLGTIGPIGVRLATRDLRAAGHGVGSVYAVSTAGSLAGTLVTGFFVIPAFETDQILLGAATLLASVGAVSLARRRRPIALAALIIPFVASSAPKPALPAGFQLVDRSQSLYGLVEVIDDLDRDVRFLRADHSIIGAQWKRDHFAAFSFIHLIESVRFLRPEAKDMLAIGLGTGSLPSILGSRGVRVDVVEIDPAVVRFAGEHFGFVPSGDVHVEDARTFLRRTERRYDLIVHDTFTGGTTPEHLLSREMIHRIRDVLLANGVLVLNFVGYQEGPRADATWAVARTLRAVFPTVRIFRDGPPDDPGAPGEHPKGWKSPAADEYRDEPANLVFFASEGAVAFDIPDGASFENDMCEHVLRSFQSWEVLTRIPEGPPITDGKNPLARLQLAVAEKHFGAMNHLLPVEVWLY